MKHFDVFQFIWTYKGALEIYNLEKWIEHNISSYNVIYFIVFYITCRYLISYNFIPTQPWMMSLHILILFEDVF